MKNLVTYRLDFILDFFNNMLRNFLSGLDRLYGYFNSTIRIISTNYFQTCSKKVLLTTKIITLSLFTGFSQYDVSTAVYTGVGETYSLVTEVPFQSAITFNNTGSKMFIVDFNNARVVEYLLGTPFDVSTAVYAGAGEELSMIGHLTLDNNHRSIVFNDTGTKMFIQIGTGEVGQYNLSTAFDVSTAAFAVGQSFFLNPEVSGTTAGLAFNDTGTKMFIAVSSFVDAVVEYDLSTAWDVSTAVWAGATEHYFFGGEDDDIEELWFDNTGMKMFLLGFNRQVQEYNLSAPYDVSTAVYAGIGEAFNLIPFEAIPGAMAFNACGTKLYVTGVLTDLIHEFDLAGTCCSSGTAAPTLSSTTLSNTCPATTADLTSITASNTPAGTINLTWHTATPATTANLVATPTAVGLGTYYAAFYDTTNDCYSGSSFNGDATTSVTVTINACGDLCTDGFFVAHGGNLSGLSGDCSGGLSHFDFDGTAFSNGSCIDAGDPFQGSSNLYVGYTYDPIAGLLYVAHQNSLVGEVGDCAIGGLSAFPFDGSSVTGAATCILSGGTFDHSDIFGISYNPATQIMYVAHFGDLPGVTGECTGPSGLLSAIPFDGTSITGPATCISATIFSNIGSEVTGISYNPSSNILYYTASEDLSGVTGDCTGIGGFNSISFDGTTIIGSATCVAAGQPWGVGGGQILGITGGCNFFTAPTCDAGTATPFLNPTFLSNTCPSTTSDLTTSTASNTPAGTISLTWHTGNPATSTNLVPTPTAVGNGVYHGAFYDSVNDCYSGSTFNGDATGSVQVFNTPCVSCDAGTAAPSLSSTALSNTCPATTADLTSITASNTPAGTINLTWHTGSPATTVNLVATPTAVNSGTYHAAFYDTTNDCYSGSTFNGDATTSVTVTINLCLTPACGFSSNTEAQVRNQVWWGGNLTVGPEYTLDFSGGTPIVTNAATAVSNSNEGAATYTSLDGILLLYTDGISVWDGQTNVQIATNIGGNFSTTQPAAIIPIPGMNPENDFYVFWNDREMSPFGYVEVDLAAGTATNNTTLETNVDEALTTLPHGNGTDAWIITVDPTTSPDTIFLYHASASGVNLSSKQVIPGLDGVSYSSTGSFVFSPVTNKLLYSHSYSFHAIMDFDINTGLISNPEIRLDYSPDELGYSAAFSASGDRIYFLDGNFDDGGATGTPAYHDLSGPVNNFTVVPGAPSSAGGVKLGPDGNIYFAHLGLNFIGMVTDPEGTPVWNTIDISPRISGLNLVNSNYPSCAAYLPTSITPDTVTVIPPCPTCPITACVVGDDLPAGAGVTTYTYCTDPAGYTGVPDGSGCVTYTGDGTNTSEVNTCIVACKNGICDTTIVIIPIPITPDTVTVIPPCPTCPITPCVVGDDLPAGAGVTTYTYCSDPAGYTGVPDGSGCVTYTGDGTNTSEVNTCIVACKNGICDTTIVIIPPPITPDTVTVIPPCPTCPITACVVGDDLPAGAGTTTYTYCTDPAGYTGVPDGSGCVTYTGDGTNTSEVNTCIVACKNGICDTTVVIIPIPITPDTVTVIPPCPTCPVTACVVGDDLPAGAGAITYTYCGDPAGYTGIPDGSGCMTYTGDGTNTSEVNTCIVACKNGI